jgi:hypothetical protein
MTAPLVPASRDSTFLPLRLVEEHLVALEGLLVLAQARAFDRRGRTLVDGLSSRMRRHEEGLRLRVEEATRLARLGLVARAATERQAAQWVLARLAGASEQEALARAAIAGLVTPRDRSRSASIAALFGEGVDEPAIVAESKSADPPLVFWALLAGSRLPRVLDEAVRWLRDEAAPPAVVRTAAFVLGRALIRGPADAGPSGAFELLVGPRLLRVPGLALVVALFGHEVTVLRLSDGLAREEGAPAERASWIAALGIVGLPRALPLLVRLASRDDQPLERRAALHAIHAITGLAIGLGEDGEPGGGSLSFDEVSSWSDSSWSEQATVPKATRSARSADREEPALGVFKGRVGTNETERHVGGQTLVRVLADATPTRPPAVDALRAAIGEAENVCRWPLALLAEGTQRAGVWGLFP